MSRHGHALASWNIWSEAAGDHSRELLYALKSEQASCGSCWVVSADMRRCTRIMR